MANNFFKIFFFGQTIYPIKLTVKTLDVKEMDAPWRPFCSRRKRKGPIKKVACRGGGVHFPLGI